MASSAPNGSSMRSTIHSKTIVDSIIEKIRLSVVPKSIYLFGSAGRGEMHENSDIDLLVVVKDGLHRRKTTQAIYRNLIGLGFAADIIVVTESNIATYGDVDGYVVKAALREGRLVYAS